MHERAVVAGEAQRAPDGRIDEPAGAACDLDRKRHGVEEVPGDADGLTGAAVQGRQLGVPPEAASDEVDLAEPTDELAAGARKCVGIGDARTAPVPSARSRAVPITIRRRRRRGAPAWAREPAQGLPRAAARRC